MTTTNQKTAATTYAYQTLVERIKASAADLGVPVTFEDRAGWVKMESTLNKHKFYVPKTKDAEAIGLCETTLPVAHLNGSRPLPKANGKIICRFIADHDLIVDSVLPLMAASDDRLPANRKPTPKKKSDDSQLASDDDSETPVGPAMPEYGI